MAGRLILVAPEQGAEFSGVWPSLHDLHIPFIKDARNVVFTARGIRKMEGWRSLLSNTGVSSPIRGILPTLTSATASIFYGTIGHIMKHERFSSGAATVGASFTGQLDQTTASAATQWSFVDWGNWVLATNGQNAPQIWKGGSFAALTTSGQFALADIFVKSGPYVLAFGVDGEAGDKTFYWCHTDDVEQWSPSSNNSAGYLVMRDLDSGIRAVNTLGDRIAVYSDGTVYIVSYVDPPFYYAATKTIEGIGAVSKQCVVAVGRMNYGLSKQGFWASDGVSFEWIDEPAIRTWFRARFNFDQSSKVCAYHDKENQQIVWYYPTTGNTEPNEGLGYNYAKGIWTIFNFGRTAAATQRIFPYPLAGCCLGKIYEHAFGKDADGEPMGCFIETARMAMGAPEHFKEILELRTGVHELTGTLSVQIAGVHDLSLSASYGQAMALTESFSKQNVREMGRYISLKYSSTSTAADWVISNIRLHGEIRGVD